MRRALRSSPARLRGVACALMLLAAAGGLADDTAGGRNVIVNRVGFTSNQFPGTATRDAEVGIDYWFKLMSDRQKTTQIPRTKVYPTIREMQAALADRQLDIVAILTQDYLAIRDEIPLEPFTIAVRSKEGLTKWAVYVSRKKGITSLEQLRGAKIIFDRTEGDDFGKTWFETLLLRQGLDPDRYATEESVDKASRAILPVYFGQADACVAPLASFSTMVEMNPAVGRELVALATSPAMAPGIVCFTREIDPGRKPDIIHTLNTLHEDPEGQQVLNLFRRDRMYPFDAAQIEPVRAILEEHRKLLESRGRGPSVTR